MVDEGDDWFVVDDLARRLTVPEITILRMTHRGEVEASGPPWRVRRRHVEAFVERSRVQPGEPGRFGLSPPPRATTVRVNRDGTPDRRYGPRFMRQT